MAAVYKYDTTNTYRKNLTSNFCYEQTHSYIVFGEIFVDQRLRNYSERFSFSGKEKDSESGYFFFGFRYHNPDLSIWLSVDPKASKFPSLSAYNYCNNSPIIITDPNGEEIWIVGEDGSEKIKYKQGMKYEGSDKTIATRVETLNNMNANANGNTVLNKLTTSDNVYTLMTNDGSCSKNSNYIDNDLLKGGTGGQIMLNDNNLSTISHELFHAYQSELGHGGGGSIVNEVEAYLFHYSVANTTYASGLYAPTVYDAAGVREYNTSVGNLLAPSASFSVESFSNVVKGFKQFSEINTGKNYSGSPYFNSNQSKSNFLIKKFFPLKK